MNITHACNSEIDTFHEKYCRTKTYESEFSECESAVCETDAGIERELEHDRTDDDFKIVHICRDAEKVYEKEEPKCPKRKEIIDGHDATM